VWAFADQRDFDCAFRTPAHEPVDSLSCRRPNTAGSLGAQGVRHNE